MVLFIIAQNPVFSRNNLITKPVFIDSRQKISKCSTWNIFFFLLIVFPSFYFYLLICFWKGQERFIAYAVCVLQEFICSMVRFVFYYMLLRKMGSLVVGGHTLGFEDPELVATKANLSSFFRLSLSIFFFCIRKGNLKVAFLFHVEHFIFLFLALAVSGFPISFPCNPYWVRKGSKGDLWAQVKKQGLVLQRADLQILLCWPGSLLIRQVRKSVAKIFYSYKRHRGFPALGPNIWARS